MVKELGRGANCDVPSARLTVLVACASRVDVSALLLGRDGKVRGDDDLIFYNAPVGAGVRYLPAAQGAQRGDAVDVDTGAVPEDVERVVVTASLDGSGPATFAQAGGLVVTVLDGAGVESIAFPVTGLTTEQALICLEVYRRGGAWKVRAVGQGYDNGLAGIASEFGVDVDTAVEEPAPNPPVGAPPEEPAATTVTLDKGRVSLEKRQTVSLVKSGAPALTLVTMGLGWDPAPGKKSIDLDASVIAFDAGGKDVDMVWFLSKQGCGGAIRHSGDNLTGDGAGDDESITVDLSRVPPGVTSLVFTVTSFSGQSFVDIRSAYCRLLDGTGAAAVELVRFDLSESPRSTGVLMCALRRAAGGTWTMTGVGEFHKAKTVRAMIEPARKMVIG